MYLKKQFDVYSGFIVLIVIYFRSNGTANRDIQGESGGGNESCYRTSDPVYRNAALNISTSTIGDEHPDLRLRSSNEFMSK